MGTIHTLHLDGMASVNEDWQTSSCGECQDDQDLAMRFHGSDQETRALKAQRRGRGRGVAQSVIISLQTLSQ